MAASASSLLQLDVAEHGQLLALLDVLAGVDVELLQHAGVADVDLDRGVRLRLHQPLAAHLVQGQRDQGQEQDQRRQHQAGRDDAPALHVRQPPAFVKVLAQPVDRPAEHRASEATASIWPTTSSLYGLRNDVKNQMMPNVTTQL